MDTFWQGLAQNLAATLIASFFGAVGGTLFSQFYQRRREEESYGGWTVLVKRGGQVEVERSVPIERAKLVLRDDSELSVYLKGIANAVGWINCDLVTEGQDNGMLERNEKRRTFTIDFDKNPPARNSGPTLRDVMNELRKLSGGTVSIGIDEQLAGGGPTSEVSAARGGIAS